MCWIQEVVSWSCPQNSKSVFSWCAVSRVEIKVSVSRRGSIRAQWKMCQGTTDFVPRLLCQASWTLTLTCPPGWQGGCGCCLVFKIEVEIWATRKLALLRYPLRRSLSLDPSLLQPFLHPRILISSLSHIIPGGAHLFYKPNFSKKEF